MEVHSQTSNGLYLYENKHSSLEIKRDGYLPISVLYPTNYVDHCIIKSINNSDDWLYKLNVYVSKKKCSDINIIVRIIRKFIDDILEEKDEIILEQERSIRKNESNKNEMLINEFLNLFNNKGKYECTLKENDIYSWNIIMKNFRGCLKNTSVILSVSFGKDFPNSPPVIESMMPMMRNSLDQKIKKMQFITKDWNGTINLTYIFDKIYEVIEKYGKLSENNCHDEVLHQIISNLSESLVVNDLKIDDGSQSNVSMNSEKINEQKKRGIGYNNKEWMMKDYIKSNVEKHSVLICTMIEINDYLNASCDADIAKNKYNYLINSDFPECIYNILSEMTAIEITENQDMFNSIYGLINNMPLEYLSQILTLSFGEQIVAHIKTNLDIIRKCASNNVSISENTQEIMMAMDEKLSACQKYIAEHEEADNTKKAKLEEAINNKVTYKNVMEKYRFNESDITKFNYYYKDHLGKQVFGKKAIIRLTAEYSALNNDLPVEHDASIFVKIDPTNMSVMRAMIIGPKDTPYENGCLIFDIFIPGTYPSEHPDIHFMNHGGRRFNPNLYNSGKVCLSLIGTWGNQVTGSSENWNPVTSTIFQLLLSVQSQILVEEPWFNEPCRYNLLNDPKYKAESKQYNNEIQYYNLQFAIINLIETKGKQYGDFAEIILNHFKLKKDEICKTYANSSSANVRTFFEAHKKCFDSL